MVIKLRKIGNYFGIILPKYLIKQYSIEDEVNITLRGGAIIIESVNKKPRAEWEEQFKAAGSSSPDDDDTMQNITNRFDEEEWTW